MKHTRTDILKLVMLLIAAVSPAIANAQWAFDVPSVEAYIADHKNQRSLLLARATLEQGNRLLHEYTATASDDYKTLNVDLDKYTRAFDVIDALYQGMRTSLNVYSTYNTVSQRVTDYKKMLNDYNERVIKRGRIHPSDTVIITVSKRCIENIAAEGKNLYRSVSDLVLYATGAAACSTADLMMVMESINLSLDNIKYQLNCAYFDTWRHIQVRIGYWKESIYTPRPKSEITNDAFGRWRQSGLNPGRKEQ